MHVGLELFDSIIILHQLRISLSQQCILPADLFYLLLQLVILLHHRLDVFYLFTMFFLSNNLTIIMTFVVIVIIAISIIITIHFLLPILMLFVSIVLFSPFGVSDLL